MTCAVLLDDVSSRGRERISLAQTRTVIECELPLRDKVAIERGFPLKKKTAIERGPLNTVAVELRFTENNRVLGGIAQIGQSGAPYYANVFPNKIPAELPANCGVNHEINLVPEAN
ncbi:hypothetical protein F442_13009 [Phytophthora nicotianae P10297]|uniref:Uncharacterized protein n=1 Tax=Phytophthora nicotianae P10297 TaxID=1317064 RepID=W2YXT8_PHYNI|nr:hypothetical protein F442_13009 [Phytophthora nicotianae P10297]